MAKNGEPDTAEKAIVVTNGQPLALIEGSPKEVVARATEMANELRLVINKQRLYADIRGKQYVTVEGWTTLGAMVGVFPLVTWCRRVGDDEVEPLGWEARVEVRTLSGQTVGAAEAQCMRSEGQWRSRDDFALRSMAQTRATSKAMRLPLAWIMSLAGFEATPAEEMPRDNPAPRNPSPPKKAPAAKTASNGGSGVLMNLQRDDRCKGCGQPIAAGTRAFYGRENGAVWHNNETCIDLLVKPSETPVRQLDSPVAGLEPVDTGP